MKNIIKIVAIASLAITPLSKADWKPVSRADDGSFYTFIQSSNIPENQIAVYFDPDNSCRARGAIFDGYPDLDREERNSWEKLAEETYDGRIQSKIDGADSGAGDTDVDVAYERGDDMAILIHRFGLERAFIKNLADGNEVKFRLRVNDGDWGKVARYPLDGSKWRLAQAKNRCEDSFNSEWHDDDNWDDDDYQSASDVW